MAVLSIQSHVVYGYAGNTAAVFPMQRLGHEVWAVNTVEFSNHTGYGSWTGKVLGADLITELLTGLEERGALVSCEAILSGYLGDGQTGGAVIDAVKRTRRHSPKAIYCCDPVMGDTGRGFYVKKDIPDIIRNQLIPLADIVCPNQFELEALTNIKITDFNDAVKAIKTLHDAGPSIILLTSFREKDSELGMIASGGKNIYKISTPELPLGNGVAGTGDMTTAVFLSHYLETKDIAKTLELCTSSVFGILETSYRFYSGKNMELRIIDAQQEFISPSYSFKAEKIII